MGSVGHPGHMFRSHEHRSDKGQVVEMGPAGEGVVDRVLNPGTGSKRSRQAATDSGIEPRCTGMCSAWASISPPGVNTAAEQSARSLMLGDKEVCRRTRPISSATEASRLRATSRVIGSMLKL